MKNEKNPTQVRLNNVRLSFWHLFTKEKPYNALEDPKHYTATFLLPKTDTKTKAEIDNIMLYLQTENKAKVSRELPLKDGDNKPEYDGYANHWYLKAKNGVQPRLMTPGRKEMTLDNNLFYSGCYVNAIINFQYYKNDFGKFIACNLLGVQFSQDGEPFETRKIANIDDFAVLEDSNFDFTADL